MDNNKFCPLINAECREDCRFNHIDDDSDYCTFHNMNHIADEIENLSEINDDIVSALKEINSALRGIEQSLDISNVNKYGFNGM